MPRPPTCARTGPAGTDRATVVPSVIPSEGFSTRISCQGGMSRSNAPGRACQSKMLSRCEAGIADFEFHHGHVFSASFDVAA